MSAAARDLQEAEDARVARALQAEEEERMSAASAEKQRQEEEKAAKAAAAALAEGARRVIASTRHTHCLCGERARPISLSAPLLRQ
jgi:hypothetical protein